MKERANTNPHITSMVLKRNANFPNSRLPLLIYHEALDLPAQKNKAATLVQKLFNRHGWSNTWRNGIYDFHHYHSNTHECMAVCSGEARVIAGGPGGKRIMLKKGDVLILPAGLGHRCSFHSPDFLCVGAYPEGKNYDTNTGTVEEYQHAIKKISKLPVPAHDPVFGKLGFLRIYWK